MTRTPVSYREAAECEVHVWNWDIVFFWGEFKVQGTTTPTPREEKDIRVSSGIVDEQGRTYGTGTFAFGSTAILEYPRLACICDGARIKVRSGNVYVLHGPRNPRSNSAIGRTVWPPPPPPPTLWERIWQEVERMRRCLRGAP